MKSVLIIEDHELNMKLLKESLSRRNYNVLEARSGKKGIEIAA
ncbi:MAG: response regulator, partial [Nitrospirae bacterium]|nr:response regulator [Nitrospirota bacterium]